MALNLDLSGIQLEFAIHNYKPSVGKEDLFTNWCNVDFHIRSGNWLNYKIDGELLKTDEVDGILSKIDCLLSGGVGEPSVWKCIEPDFNFTFHPKKDLTKDPKYIYVQPGCEIEDIKLEWDVYFWNGGLTDNRLTLVLYRDDIIALQQYLMSVIK